MLYKRYSRALRRAAGLNFKKLRWSMRRWIIIGTVTLAVVLLLGFVSVWTHFGRRKTAELENWIGRQIVAVVQNYVHPRIAFAALHYQPPRTVLISGFSLSAGAHTILSVDRTSLQLAEVPHRGKPIQVQRVEFERPKLLFLSEEQGGLVGWTDFLNREAVRRPDTVPAGRRFSDILVLRHVEIHNGEVTYDDAGDDSAPMTLPGVDLTLDTPPDAESPGWYRLMGTLQRAPVFRLQLDGRINLDTALLEFAKLNLQLALGEEQYHTLPPALQRLLRSHAVQGALTAEAEGQIPLRKSGESQVQVRARLEDGTFAYGGAAFPVKSVEVDAQLPKGPIHLSASAFAVSAGGQTIASADGIALDLPTLPGAGEPLRIEQLQLDSPRLAFWRDGKGGYAGWSDLRSSSARRGPRMAADAERTARPAAETVQRILEKVSLGALQVRNGGVLYEDRAGKPLVVEGFNATLHPSRAPNAPETWQLEGTFDVPSFLTSQFDGRFNADTLDLDIERLELKAELTEAGYASLSPRMRKSLPAEQLFGGLTAGVQVHVPLAAPAQATAQAQVEVTDGYVVYRDTVWPFARLSAAGSWPEGPVNITGENLQMRGREESVLTVPRLALELPYVPRPGQPLEISRLVLDSPQVELREVPGGGFAGWNELLGKEQQPPAPRPPASEGQESGAHWRLRSLEARDGALRLASLASPYMMSIRGINVALASAPNAGWYDLNGTVRQAPALDMTFAGVLNPTQSLLELSDLRLTAEFGENRYAILPPKIQTIVRGRDVRGTLQAHVTGLLAWRDPQRTQARVSAQVNNGHVALGRLEWPIQTLQVTSQIRAGEVAADYAGTLLGGEVSGSAQLALGPPKTFTLNWNAAGLQLEQMLRVAEGRRPSHAGRIVSTGTISWQAGAWPASLSGSGTLRITQGRLIELPVIRDVLALIARTRLGSRLTSMDSADATFSIHPDYVYLSRADIITVLAALYGRGRVYYDKRLDLDVRASPLGELQRLTGRIGEALGRLTGDIITYKVQGTIARPVIRPVPLGL
ncbi:MAG TPA: AsmA-like C-terminal region-containing protein [Phycisphaerae bacterium]|nr:AsmA-like C-terminal region-containing protein [Phycisphaerae bacterium]